MSQSYKIECTRINLVTDFGSGTKPGNSVVASAFSRKIIYAAVLPEDQPA